MGETRIGLNGEIYGGQGKGGTKTTKVLLKKT